MDAPIRTRPKMIASASLRTGSSGEHPRNSPSSFPTLADWCDPTMSRTPTKVDDATKEPAGTARNAGLHYVSDQMSGVRRRRAGSGFIYLGPDGRRVTDARVLAR